MASLPSLVLDVRGVPELIWACRKELANVLRQEAEGEANPAVARKLMKLAALFEAGQS